MAVEREGERTREKKRERGRERERGRKGGYVRKRESARGRNKESETSLQRSVRRDEMCERERPGDRDECACVSVGAGERMGAKK